MVEASGTFARFWAEQGVRSTTPQIGNIYELACREGAPGEKLWVAVRGIHATFFEPEEPPHERKELSSFLHVPFMFEELESLFTNLFGWLAASGRAPRVMHRIGACGL
jgi:hypothetical protein